MSRIVTKVDIAIIGGGPVGTLLANLLGQRGLSVLVIEKQPRPYDLPRAIHFDGEAMRVFQSAGLAQAVLPHTHVGVGMLFQDGQGKTLIDWSRAQTIGPMGWYESYRFYQPGLEAALTEGLSRFENVKRVHGCAVTRLSQDADQVRLTLETGEEVTARYAVGCDGAQSFTRNQLDVAFEDLGFRERWLVVDCKLTRPRPDLGDHSIQYCDPDTPATYVRGVEDWRRWEMRVEDDRTTITDAEVWEKLSRWITPADATLERAALYTFRSAIARKWQVGRVFLAGDAAHLMPPFMGQGMCAGVRDAANLAWKLAAATGGQDVLASYGSERAANLRSFVEMTMRLGRLINQTAAGAAPRGQMKSIWPALGPGLGVRDGIAGSLAPQEITGQGHGDDQSASGFTLLCAEPTEGGLTDTSGWLAEKGLNACLIRPDGYVLETMSTGDPATLIQRHRALIEALPARRGYPLRTNPA